MQDIRRAKRMKLSNSMASAEDSQQGDPLPHEDDGVRGSLPEDAHGTSELGARNIQNLAWWDDVGYGSLATDVRTLGAAPSAFSSELAYLRGAVAQSLLDAHGSSDGTGVACTAKLLTFPDRLVLGKLPKVRGGRSARNSGSLGRILSRCLRMAWQ